MRLLATIVLVVLAPVLLAPSCTHAERDPPDPDSKRALRQGLVGGTLVLDDGVKALTAPRATCVYRGPGGIRDPQTGVTSRCVEGSSGDPANSLPIEAGDRFRVLHRTAEAMEVYALPSLAAPLDSCPGQLPLVERREDRGKGRSRWDFRLRTPVAPPGIRIVAYGTYQVTCYDLGISAPE